MEMKVSIYLNRRVFVMVKNHSNSVVHDIIYIRVYILFFEKKKMTIHMK